MGFDILEAYDNIVLISSLVEHNAWYLSVGQFDIRWFGLELLSIIIIFPYYAWVCINNVLRILTTIGMEDG